MSQKQEGADPASIAASLTEAQAVEERIMAALTDAYQRGEIEYLFYSAAYDTTVARAAAISFAIQHLQDTRHEG